MKHSTSHTKPQSVFHVKEQKSKAIGPKIRKEAALGKRHHGAGRVGEAVQRLGRNDWQFRGKLNRLRRNDSSVERSDCERCRHPAVLVLAPELLCGCGHCQVPREELVQGQPGSVPTRCPLCRLQCRCCPRSLNCQCSPLILHETPAGILEAAGFVSARCLCCRQLCCEGPAERVAVWQGKRGRAVFPARGRWAQQSLPLPGTQPRRAAMQPPRGTWR